MLRAIFTTFLTIISAILSSGLVIKFLDNLRAQKRFTAMMKCLRNESDYNSKHRGSAENPFQYEWLTRSLDILDFHEQLQSISQDYLRVFELMKDANHEQLNKRGKSPADIHRALIDLVKRLDAVMPQLNHRATLWGYMRWEFMPYFDNLFS